MAAETDEKELAAFRSLFPHCGIDGFLGDGFKAGFRAAQAETVPAEKVKALLQALSESAGKPVIVDQGLTDEGKLRADGFNRGAAWALVRFQTLLASLLPEDKSDG